MAAETRDHIRGARRLHLHRESGTPLLHRAAGGLDGYPGATGRPYAQQQIRELSVEYLLGALDAVDQRVARQRTTTLENALRASAKLLAEQAAQTFLRQGWAVDWSGNGSVKEIEARWSAQTLREALARDAEIDIKKQRAIAVERVVALRRIVTTDPVDPSNVSAGSSASQLVVDLKQRRHKINSELRTFRGQYADSEHLYESLRPPDPDSHRCPPAEDDRRRTARTSRVPDLPSRTRCRCFNLTEQTGPEVQAHIEALKRDRVLTRQTLNAIGTIIRIHRSGDREARRRAAQRRATLRTSPHQSAPCVNRSCRAARTSPRSNAHRKARRDGRRDRRAAEAIDAWLRSESCAAQGGTREPTSPTGVAVFTKALGPVSARPGPQCRRRSRASRISGWMEANTSRIWGIAAQVARLRKRPGATRRRIHSRPRGGGRHVEGLHPGVVILDEPLQQNPDTRHLELFLDFLSQDLAKNAKFQTLVFTFLNDEEVQKLRDSGTTVITVDGHLLEPVAPPEPEQPEATK